MISEITQKLKKKEISCVEITSQYLEKVEKNNPEINAFITVTKKEAMQTAKNVDAEIANSNDLEGLFIKKPLLGIPIAHKDIFTTKGIETTAGSSILKGYIPPFNATVVDKLNNSGVVTLGKLNCDAFAHGTTGENSDFGPTKNPYNLLRVAGGSSSGTAASVASGMTVFSTGTDTGGSLRNPASFTNIVAIKPTYGRVSRYGIIAMASSLDSIGHITINVEDSAIILQQTAGFDKHDATSSTSEVTNYLENINGGVKGLKIGIPKEYMTKDLDSEVKDITTLAIKKYEELGAEIIPISLPHTEQALAVYYIITPSEVSSNLGRFDGIRFGHNRDKFGDEAKRRIMIGTYVLSAGYYDAYYLKAQKVRTLVIEDFKKAFENVDVILAPVVPVLPPKIGENVNDPLKLYLMDVLTVPINLAGLPALSVPAGFSKSGLPVGIQLVGNHFAEGMLYRVGKSLENVLKLYERRPFYAK